MDSAVLDKRYLDTLRPAWYVRIWRWFWALFGEENFSTTGPKRPGHEDRVHSIRLSQIGLDSAKKLISRGFKGLDLSEDEMITVILHTVRILMIEDKLKERLNADGLQKIWNGYEIPPRPQTDPPPDKGR